MKTLIKPRDVVELANMALPANACNFRQLFNIEVFEFRHSLGEPFRLALLAAMEDYSTAVMYRTGVTYALGTVVKYSVNESVEYYKAKEETSTIPTNIDKWEIASRFNDTTCGNLYEELYCDYLAPWLALSVMIKRLPYLHTLISDKGTIQYNGGNYSSVDKAGKMALLWALESDRLIAFSNMIAWLQGKRDNACFSMIDFYTACSCVANRKQYGRYQRYQYKFG